MITGGRARTYGHVGRIVPRLTPCVLPVLLLLKRMYFEKPVHGFGPGRQDRPLAVARACRPPRSSWSSRGRRAGRSPRSVRLRWNQRHERMPQFPRRPVLADLGGLTDHSEFPPDISRVQGSARPGGKNQITVARCHARSGPFVGLPLLIGTQRVHRHLGQGQRPARLLGLGIPV
jgi:hypothetical protein